MSGNRDFARRLNISCDYHPHVPPYGKGQQTWLAGHLGISQEAVRRWFVGESRPRPHLMTKLAHLLEVNESWLALGVSGGAERPSEREYSEQADGATYICFGFFKASGFSCAFAKPSDAFDFHAIKRGRHFLISVSSAFPKSKNIYAAPVANIGGEAVYLCVATPAPGAFEILSLDWDLVTVVGRLSSDHWEIELHRDEHGCYSSNGQRWKSLKRPDQLLQRNPG